MSVSLLKKVIPSGPEVMREAFIVLGGILIAAWIISRFPQVQKFVQGSSINLKDANGNTII
jgi:hypothetical protein